MAKLGLVLMTSSPVRPMEHKSLVGSGSQQEPLEQSSHFGDREREERAIFLGAPEAAARARSAASAA